MFSSPQIKGQFWDGGDDPNPLWAWGVRPPEQGDRLIAERFEPFPAADADEPMFSYQRHQWTYDRNRWRRAET